jgi:hypothetical protein
MAKNLDGVLAIARWSKHVGTRQLHGPESHSMDLAAGQKIRIVVHVFIPVVT